MKVLMIDHLNTQLQYRAQADELVKNFKIDLFLIIPDKWYLNNKLPVYPESIKKNSRYKIEVVKLYFAHFLQISVYDPLKIFKIIKDFKPDIIHHIQEPFALSTLVVGLIKFLFFKDTKLIIRSSLMKEQPVISKKANFLFKIIEKLTLPLVDYVHCINKKALNYIQSKGVKNASVVYHGRSEKLFHYTINNSIKKKFKNKNEIILGYAGVLTKQKNISTLIKAFKKLKKENLKLMIIGNGPEKERLFKEAEGDERIIFVNYIPLNQMKYYLSLIDIFILPSITLKYEIEVFGRVLIEAMACKCAVIGSSSGAIPEVIGNSGLIFKEGSVEDLISKIKFLLQNRKILREYQLKAYRHFKENFTMLKRAERFYEIYKSIICK